jgi:soluble cytochrome b562
MTKPARNTGRKGRSLALGITLLSALYCVPAQAGEVKRVMKDMKAAFNGAMGSSSMGEFSQYMARFQNDVTHASKLQYKSDPSTYQQGMQELQKEIDAVNVEVHANNLPGAKGALRKMIPTRKHYHDLLS